MKQKIDTYCGIYVQCGTFAARFVAELFQSEGFKKLCKLFYPISLICEENGPISYVNVAKRTQYYYKILTKEKVCLA